MSERSSVDDTWEEDELPAKVGPSDNVTMDAVRKWLMRANAERLRIHMRATDPSQAEREMAFAEIAAELVRATRHLRILAELGERLKAENTVLRKAVTRLRSAMPEPQILTSDIAAARLG